MNMALKAVFQKHLCSCSMHRKNNSAIQFVFEIKLQCVLRPFITEIGHAFNTIEMQLEIAKHFFPYSAVRNLLKKKNSK